MDKLKELRKQKKWTQQQVADKLGITYQAYGHYENGRRDIPTDILIKLSEIFSTSVDEIINNKNSAFSAEIASANFIYFLEKNIHKITKLEDL